MQAKQVAHPAGMSMDRAAAPVRLTRRGRLVVLFLLITLLLVGFSLGRVSSSATTHNPPRAERRTVIVEPGQTLWSIARDLAPHADPREVVGALRDLNNLGNEPIVVGQQIVLP
jgi:Tfp pilus assembly protein FimV